MKPETRFTGDLARLELAAREVTVLGSTRSSIGRYLAAQVTRTRGRS